MGYYTVEKSGSTDINTGTEEHPKKQLIQYKRGKPVEAPKGALDHVPGAEYHQGNPPKSKENAKKK